MSRRSVKLAQKWVAKTWGSDALPAPFGDMGGMRMGELWFEPAPPLQRVLAKFLFTSDKLSVQVHPAAGEGASKDECWLILDAKPDAMIALGVRDTVSRDSLRDAAVEGTIEELLSWQHVARGDFIFVPAGTIHAIGAGITLIEIQQNCDITYRLYDYGRPRALHLDEAVHAANCEKRTPVLRREIDFSAPAVLVEGPNFVAEIITDAGAPRPALVMPLEGTLTCGSEEVSYGECAMITAADDVRFSAGSSALIAYEKLSS